MRKTAVIFLLIALVPFTAYAQQTDTQKIDAIFGRSGAMIDDVYKFTFPRTDLKVGVDSLVLEPAAGLTSWVAFKTLGGGTSMATGDLVLLESEVYPVTRTLIAEGIGITAIHNHLFGTTPNIMYLHFSGTGDAARIADSLRKALASTMTPLGAQPQAAASTIDWAEVESIIGVKGQHTGNVDTITIPRADTVTENGTILQPAMGTGITLYFQMAGSKCATTGDFVLIADEVNPVIKVLTDNNITVTALHNHMLREEPRLFYLHFWGFDDPGKVARALSFALDRINAKR
ncbi:MAG TPA: DUF1259 domain-containing protein [Dissulfurispiraceae bacterium]